MKLLILVSIITWSFNGGYQNLPSAQIVISPENAAIVIFKDINRNSIVSEPDRKKWTLYEFDIIAKTVVEVKIPNISFKID